MIRRVKPLTPCFGYVFLFALINILLVHCERDHVSDILNENESNPVGLFFCQWPDTIIQYFLIFPMAESRKRFEESHHFLPLSSSGLLVF